MSRITKGIATVVMMMSIIPVMAADSAQIAKDWVRMDELLTERDYFLYQSKFDPDPEAFAGKWMLFADTFRTMDAGFRERYGSDRNTWMKTFESVGKPEEATREYYAIVNEFLGADIDGLHRTIVGWAESTGKEQLGNWERLSDPDPKKVELRHKYAKRALAAYKAAALLAPDAGYGDRVKDCEKAERETREAFLTTMKELTWPGHNPDFDGPGKAKDLAGAALEFLEANPKWSKPEYDDVHKPYAACVSGRGWDIWKRNPLTEEPTQYSVDILVAFEGEKDPDVVYVYSMVFYTEEAGGIKPGLPFKYANSKQYQKYQMLKSSVPEGVSSKKAKRADDEAVSTGSSADDSGGSAGKTAAASADTGRTRRGGSFGVWRLLFGLILIAGGSIGARTWLAGTIPAAKPVLDKMTGFTLPAGIALLFIGLAGFLCNLIRFVPHASFLPQACGILLGLLLVRGNQGFLPKDIVQKIAVLEPYETPLGLAAIVLGVLHLILGGLPML